MSEPVEETISISAAEVAALLEQLAEVKASQERTEHLVSAFIEGIQPAINEVIPKLEAIASSSWFRMVSGGKKK